MVLFQDGFGRGRLSSFLITVHQEFCPRKSWRPRSPGINDVVFLGLRGVLECPARPHIPSDQTPPAVPTSSLPLSPPQSWLVTRATFMPSAHSASLLTAPGNKDRGQEGRCSCTMPPSLPLPLSLLKYQVCPLPCPNKEPLSY